MRTVAIGAIAAIASLAATGGAQAAVASYGIRAMVPVHCQARLIRTAMPAMMQAGGAAAATNNLSLGQLSEYCNAPRGYRLMIRYTPGSLAGTTIRIGEDAVVLNGSGMATLSESRIPRIRSRMISAQAGEGGLQTQQLDLFMIPMA